MSKNVISLPSLRSLSINDDGDEQKQARSKAGSSKMEVSQFLTLSYPDTSAQCCPSSSASTSTSAVASPVSELTEFDLSTRNGGSSRASPDTDVDGDSDGPLPVSSIILGGGVFVSLQLANYLATPRSRPMVAAHSHNFRVLTSVFFWDLVFTGCAIQSARIPFIEHPGTGHRTCFRESNQCY